MDGREQDRAKLLPRCPCGYDIPSELVISAVGDDKLHLIIAGEPRQVLQGVTPSFPAARAFHVDDLHHIGGHPVEGQMTTGFEHHVKAVGQ